MRHLTVTADCSIDRSRHVAAIENSFGYVAKERDVSTFSGELPDDDDSWMIGVIVGPSGSGKSLLASEAFPDAYAIGPKIDRPWPENKAFVDCLGDASFMDVARTLGAVGLSSVPSWVKPFRVLSQGERFRAELARALLSNGSLTPALSQKERESESEPAPLTIVADEFTSALDREVARSACRAVARHVRCEVTQARLVAVTCHEDVLPWLDPDWVLDMSTGRLSRRRLRRRPERLSIYACHRREWPAFGRHHYLNDGELHSQSKCFAVVTESHGPVAFASLLHVMGMKGVKRISRLVVLPQFQGLGVGRKLADWIGERCLRDGLGLRISTAHPAMIAALNGSPKWRVARRARCREHGSYGRWTRSRLLGRTLTTFEYIGDRGQGTGDST